MDDEIEIEDEFTGNTEEGDTRVFDPRDQDAMSDNEAPALLDLIVTTTNAGKLIGEYLTLHSDRFDHTHKPTPYAEYLQAHFKERQRIICVASADTVSRALAPALQLQSETEFENAPVLVVDEQGKYVAPIVDNEDGDADKWAKEIAHLLQAQPVITSINRKIKPIYVAGICCDVGCPLEVVEEAFLKTLRLKHLLPQQISSIASINVRSLEAGLVQLAQKHHKPYRYFGNQQLQMMDEQLSVRITSEFKEFRCYGVAESAALFQASALTGNPAHLQVEVVKGPKVSCAIAVSYRESY